MFVYNQGDLLKMKLDPVRKYTKKYKYFNLSPKIKVVLRCNAWNYFLSNSFFLIQIVKVF